MEVKKFTDDMKKAARGLDPVILKKMATKRVEAGFEIAADDIEHYVSLVSLVYEGYYLALEANGRNIWEFEFVDEDGDEMHYFFIEMEEFLKLMAA